MPKLITASMSRATVMSATAVPPAPPLRFAVASLSRPPPARSTRLRAARMAIRTNPATVLVADDDPAVRDLVACKLGSAGYGVLLAADGSAALAAVERRRPDLVVLDGTMPGRSGYDVCRQLRDDPGTAALPVIMLTDSSQPVDRVAAGADSYLVKPFGPGELVGQVAELLVRVC